MTVTLQQMSQTEYDAWYRDAVGTYAQEFVDSRILDAAAARERAETDFEQLLPQGLDTENHLLWTARDDTTVVGTIWIALMPDRTPPHSFVYALDVDPGQRRRGYGQAIMEAAMQECRDRGVATMGLNVFGHNDTARRLYDRLGFAVTSTSMKITL